MHRYLPPGVEEGTPVADSLSQNLAIDGPAAAHADADAGEPSPFEKYDPLLHIGIGEAMSSTRRRKPKKQEVLSIAFVKKYIQYAKSKSAPVLTKGAADWIVNVYASLRNEDPEGNKKKVRATILSYDGRMLMLLTRRPHSPRARSRRSSVSPPHTPRRVSRQKCKRPTRWPQRSSCGSRSTKKSSSASARPRSAA